MIIGIGGVGSVAAEMLTRCGIGKLILYDYDKVELANMNRLFFTPSQNGLSKVDAAKETLKFINPDVEFECYNMDVTLLSSYAHLQDHILHGGLNKQRIDLLLCCVDNYNARTVINQICLNENQVWMETGVSEDSLSGHIQLMIPGCTACFLCIPPYILASGINESTLKREGVCSASLPTTVSLISALCAQNTLKYLFHLGQIAYYTSYSALTNYVSSSVLYPNKDCICEECKRKQIENGSLWKPDVYISISTSNDSKKIIHHDDNDWNIQVVDSGIDSNENNINNNLMNEQNTEEMTIENIKEIDDLMNELNNL